jgi:hypothetical protein
MARALILMSLAGALALAGCTSTHSDNVKTQGMSASFVISGEDADQQVTARATFQVGSTYVDLVGDDEVSCDGVKLGRDASILGSISYTALVPRKAPSGQYVFELSRDDGDYESYGTAPALVHMTAPAEGTTVALSHPTTVKWAAAKNGSLTLSAGAPGCVISDVFSPESDQSSYTVPASDLSFAPGEKGPCAGSIGVDRTIANAGSNAFESSSVEVTTSDSVDVMFGP